MIKFFLFLIGVKLFFSTFSCQESNLSIDMDKTTAQLKELIEKNKFRGQGVINPFADTLAYLYRQNNYMPFWIIAAKDTQNVKELLTFLQNADAHGINPERYCCSKLEKDFQTLWLNKANSGDFDYTALCQFEFSLSASYLLYQHDILYGVVNPRELDPVNYDIPLPKHFTDGIINLFSIDRVKALEIIQPKNERYIKLQQALVSYSHFAGTKKWTKVPLIDGKIKKGEKSKIISLIARNLKEEGLLDSCYNVSESGVYDTSLFNAVVAFQSRFGIANDGVIGKNTIEQMNISPKDRVEIIKINLERFRWTTYSDSSRYILVNIPDFHVYTYSDGKVFDKIKVCTGQKRENDFDRKNELFRKTKNILIKPKNHETPQVASRIGLIITNPLWGVPESIAKNEMLGDILKEPEYLQEHNYKVYKSGKEVDASKIDWKIYSRLKLPFTFVQDAGPGNALGKIKFIFKNKFSIYLHDTPTRLPFSSAVRAVSHGCVRVEKPLQLAEFILLPSAKFSMDDIKSEIGIKPENEKKIARYKANLGKKPHTRDFSLDVSVPVYVDYFTAWVDAGGILQFRADIYEKDKLLAKALFSEGDKKISNNK